MVGKFPGGECPKFTLHITYDCYLRVMDSPQCFHRLVHVLLFLFGVLGRSRMMYVVC